MEKNVVFNCHFLSFLLLLLLTGCGTPVERQVRQTLRCAEEVLAEHPDSALTLLTPLDTMSLAGEEQAWYAVLRTQAVYKLWCPVTDSLPLLATAYYGTPRRPHYRAAMAWYSLGCVYTDHNDDPRAIDAYLKARDLFPDTLCRYYALTEQNLGQHYLNRRMLDAAEQVFRHYHDLSVLRGDSTDVGFSHFYLGRAYLYRLDYAHAAPYYDSVLVNPHSTKDVRNRCLLDQTKLAIYHAHDYERGFQLIDRYRKAFRNDDYLQIVPGIRGDLFSAVGQNDSAYACYSLSVQHAQDIYVLCNDYNHLAELSARLGRAEESIKYFKLQCQYRDSIYHLRRTDEIAQIEQRHAAEVHELKEREERTRLVILLSAAVMFILVVAFLSFRYYRVRHEADYLHRIKALQDQIRSLSSSLSETYGEQEHPVADGHSLHSDADLETLRQMVHSSIQLFVQSHKQEHQTLLLHESPLTQRDAFSELLTLSFTEVIAYLKTTYPSVTKDEVLMAICALLGYDTPCVAELQAVSDSAIRSRKNRLKNKVPPAVFAIFFPEQP